MKKLSFFAALSLSAATLPALAASSQPQAIAPANASIAVGSDISIVPPEGWKVTREGSIVRFDPPEANLAINLVPVADATNGAEAAAAAWKLAKPGFARPVHLSETLPARNGWDEVVAVNYDVPPAENALAQAVASRKGKAWTVVTIEGAISTHAKRGAQINASTDTLRPANFVKESFAGRKPNPLDAARVAQLESFIRNAMRELKVPGAGIALIDKGQIVYEGGIGVKDIGTGAPVDKDTLFMIASNTKGMATLLLSRLVDQGRLDWNKPVIDYLPIFRLGDEETTRKVLVKHLVCACTGLPRKDMLWLFNTRPDTGADETFIQLAATEPTSGFGEVYQYNNLMASAAGYLGAHVLFPDMELGAAFDRAIQTQIFDPLNMHGSTLSNRKAIAGNWAKPYDTDLDNRIAPVDMRFNDTVVPYRPSGGAWSSAHDMALFVLNELTEGVLPNGKRMVSAANLLARRAHNVPTGENQWYGMGLEDDASSGVSIISHGGSLFGYKSNWFALPASGIGVVVLTNSENGYTLANQVKRKLLELVFDGKPEAEENVASSAKRSADFFTKFRSEITLPFTAEAATAYVGDYSNPELGPLSVQHRAGNLMVRATSIWSDMAMRKNKDGSMSLVTISPGIAGLELLAAKRDGKRGLILNDGQHEYIFLASEEAKVTAE